MNDNKIDNEQEENEILNINYHRKRLLIRSLNKFNTKKDAAKVLGLSDRNLYKLINDFNLKYDKENKLYYEVVN